MNVAANRLHAANASNTPPQPGESVRYGINNYGAGNIGKYFDEGLQSKHPGMMALAG